MKLLVFLKYNNSFEVLSSKSSLIDKKNITVVSFVFCYRKGEVELNGSKSYNFFYYVY